MRDDYAAFTAREAEILAIGPDGPAAYQRYWSENNIPFVGLPDPKHVVANLYRQQVNLLKLGRMPALMVVDRDGMVRYQHYGDSMADIPDNQLLFNIVDAINRKVTA